MTRYDPRAEAAACLEEARREATRLLDELRCAWSLQAERGPGVRAEVRAEERAQLVDLAAGVLCRLEHVRSNLAEICAGGAP